MPRQVTVILPCAGKGTRMRVPFPKELLPLGPGRCVIDSCLDLIRVASEASDVRVLLMTDGNREATAAYLRARLPGVPAAGIIQDPQARDWPAAVLALSPWLSPYSNILLLPDVIYTWTGDPVTEIAAKAASAGFAAGAVKASPQELAHAGALRVEDDRIAAYEDKPADPSGYDALWGILGFSGGAFGLDALRLIAASVSREIRGPVTHPSLRLSPVTWLEGFRDCGTWDGYRAGLRES